MTEEHHTDELELGAAQRASRLVHRLKARFRAKERRRVAALSRFIPAGGVIADVGAHFGYFGKEFCRLHGASCSVYCFEPFSYNFSILTSVLARFDNACPVRLALSDAAGEAQLYVPLKRLGKLGPGLAHLGAETRRDFIVERIATATLDEWARSNRISRVDFIKCDVEGAELPMLRGAAHTIERASPAVLCEIDAAYTQRLAYSPTELFAYLRDYGYVAARLIPGSHALVPVAGYDGRGDYLFTHAKTATGSEST